MSIEISPLGEVVKVRYGYSFPAADFSSKGIPAIRMSDLSNYIVDTKSAARVPVEYWDKLPNYRITKGDLIVGMSGSVGKFAIYNNKEPALQNQRVGVLKIKAPKKIDQSYLHYFAFTLEEKLLEIGKGVAVKNVSAKEIEELPIPLPPLPEQKRIAAQLAQADRLRQLRRNASQLGESYLQSAFLAMFGNPETNPKGWDTVKIGDKLKFMTSGSRGWAKYYAEKGDLFLRVQNLGANRLLLDDVAYVDAPDNAESKRTKVKAGDLLLSATADLGRTGVIPENFPTTYVNQHLFILRLKSDLNPYFVAGYYSTEKGKAQILQLDREGVKSGLNFDDVKSLRIFYPPLPEQERFAQIVARYEKLRSQMRESTRQAEMLFQGLLHESFGG